MSETSNLNKLEARCSQVMSSPYLRKETPPELKNLRTVLQTVSQLITEDLPPLITEIRQLRSRNKKLEAELEALRSANEAATNGAATADEEATSEAAAPAEASTETENGA
ncbi:MAG: hypothetical protein M3437_12015 [Chloroflexota bacterium]|nr:hypothetical protein [Chloroflexota bacterium]MDQ5865514.1 hypothetical protein [Chloroflexota bacterium]